MAIRIREEDRDTARQSTEGFTRIVPRPAAAAAEFQCSLDSPYQHSWTDPECLDCTPARQFRELAAAFRPQSREGMVTIVAKQVDARHKWIRRLVADGAVPNKARYRIGKRD